MVSVTRLEAVVAVNITVVGLGNTEVGSHTLLLIEPLQSVEGKLESAKGERTRYAFIAEMNCSLLP